MASEQDCIEALLDAAQRLGESPTKKQYEELDITPSASTILRHCGGWNDAKEQAGLETNQAKGGPKIQEMPDHVDLPDHLDWEELSQDQRWHYKNREWNTQRSLERRQRLRRWVNEQKSERGCSQCVEDDPACLDLHHRNSDEKEMTISTMITYGHGKESLQAELEKCEVLCANCHRAEHDMIPDGVAETGVSEEAKIALSDGDGWEAVSNHPARQRSFVFHYKQRTGCNRCDASRPGCLELHHLDSDEKTAAVSQLISQGCSAAELRRELRKCIVLCSNCHRREHYQGPLPG